MSGEFGRKGDPGDPGLRGDNGLDVRQNKENLVENKDGQIVFVQRKKKTFPFPSTVLCCRAFLGWMVCQARKVKKGTQFLSRRKVLLCYLNIEVTSEQEKRYYVCLCF